MLGLMPVDDENNEHYQKEDDGHDKKDYKRNFHKLFPDFFI